MRAALIICRRCGSPIVDVHGWTDERSCTVGCSHCGHTGTLTGFTLGRADIEPHAVADALEDAALPRVAVPQ